VPVRGDRGADLAVLGEVALECPPDFLETGRDLSTDHGRRHGASFSRCNA
jgi:hypothetical protein